MLEGISDAFVSLDFDWNISHVNGVTAAWGQFAAEAVIGQNLWEVFPVLRGSSLDEAYRRCMATRQPQSLEYYSPPVKRWFHVRVRPDFQGLSVFMTDITEKKQIADGEDQFRMMANAIPQLGWMANAEGWIHWYNDRWYEFTGTTLGEMQGWGWQKVHHPEYVERVIDFVKQSWPKKESWEYTFPLRGHDGQYRWFLTKAFPVQDSAGNILHWIGTNTDIHDQKQSADLLESKVAERTHELNQLNEHLQSANEELQQFNYIASHDLQEPLRKIKIFSERIKMQDFDKLSSGSQGALDRITMSVDRMSNLLRDLLAFSSADRESLFTRVNLNEIVTEIESDLEMLVAQKAAIVMKSDLPTIDAIPLQMRQLFYNLLNNAVKFATPERNPLVRIECAPLNQKKHQQWQLPANRAFVQLSVMDNGIGFEPEYADKIFELFKRLHNQQTYQGTGVGLALCKKVVENHQGRIWAESEYGRGAAFHVILPVK